MRNTFWRSTAAALAALALTLFAVPAAAQTPAPGSSARPVTYVSEKFTAESWVKNTAYSTVGVRIVNGANVYQVITAGTSENTDNAGPKTTASDITDGTVHWKWLGTTTALGIDNTSTAGEAALATTVDVAGLGLDSLTILAKAVGTSSDRVLTLACLAKDGTTALFTYPTVAVAANGKVMVVLRANVTVPATAPTGVTYLPLACPTVKISMAAITAGAGITADLAVYGRKIVAERGASPFKNLYESGSVGSGGALSSGVLDASRYDQLTVLTEATTTNRTLVVSCMSKDGVNSLFDFASLTVTAGAKFMRVFRTDAPIPGTEPTNVLHIPVDLCPKMQATIAATGSASAKLAVYAR